MINLTLLICVVIKVSQIQALVQLRTSLASSDNPLLTKILQSIDAATSDEHLFEVTLKLLKSLCACMRDTLKAKEDTYNSVKNLIGLSNIVSTEGKVLDIYKNIYNNTCFNLKQDLFKHNTSSESWSHSHCGKDNNQKENNTAKNEEDSRTVKNVLRSKLDHILYRALVQTRRHHKYNIKKYNLFGRAKSKVKSSSKHTLIVILTLHPARKDLRKYNVVEEDLHKILHKNSTIDIDIIDTRYDQKGKESEEAAEPEIYTDCHLQSLYTYLAESEKKNLTKVFRFLRRRDTIKIYIEVFTGRNHSDYINICCVNGTISSLCKKELIESLNSQEDIAVQYKILDKKKSQALKNSFKNTISKLKKLVKRLDHRPFHNLTSNLNINVTDISHNITNENSAKPATLNDVLKMKENNSNLIIDQLGLKSNSLPNLVGNLTHPLKLQDVSRAIILLNRFVSKKTTINHIKTPGTNKTDYTQMDLMNTLSLTDIPYTENDTISHEEILPATVTNLELFDADTTIPVTEIPTIQNIIYMVSVPKQNLDILNQNITLKLKNATKLPSLSQIFQTKAYFTTSSIPHERLTNKNLASDFVQTNLNNEINTNDRNIEVLPHIEVNKPKLTVNDYLQPKMSSNHYEDFDFKYSTFSDKRVKNETNLNSTKMEDMSPLTEKTNIQPVTQNENHIVTKEQNDKYKINNEVELTAVTSVSGEKKLQTIYNIHKHTSLAASEMKYTTVPTLHKFSIQEQSENITDLKILHAQEESKLATLKTQFIHRYVTEPNQQQHLEQSTILISNMDQKDMKVQLEQTLQEFQTNTPLPLEATTNKYVNKLTNDFNAQRTKKSSKKKKRKFKTTVSTFSDMVNFYARVKNTDRRKPLDSLQPFSTYGINYPYTFKLSNYDKTINFSPYTDSFTTKSSNLLLTQNNIYKIKLESTSSDIPNHITEIPKLGKEDEQIKSPTKINTPLIGTDQRTENHNTNSHLDSLVTTNSVFVNTNQILDVWISTDENRIFYKTSPNITSLSTSTDKKNHDQTLNAVSNFPFDKRTAVNIDQGTVTQNFKQGQIISKTTNEVKNILENTIDGSYAARDSSPSNPILENGIQMQFVVVTTTPNTVTFVKSLNPPTKLTITATTNLADHSRANILSLNAKNNTPKLKRNTISRKPYNKDTENTTFYQQFTTREEEISTTSMSNLMNNTNSDIKTLNTTLNTMKLKNNLLDINKKVELTPNQIFAPQNNEMIISGNNRSLLATTKFYDLKGTDSDSESSKSESTNQIIFSTKLDSANSYKHTLSSGKEKIFETTTLNLELSKVPKLSVPILYTIDYREYDPIDNTINFVETFENQIEHTVPIDKDSALVSRYHYNKTENIESNSRSIMVTRTTNNYNHSTGLNNIANGYKNNINFVGNTIEHTIINQSFLSINSTKKFTNPVKYRPTNTNNIIYEQPLIVTETDVFSTSPISHKYKKDSTNLVHTISKKEYNKSNTKVIKNVNKMKEIVKNTVQQKNIPHMSDSTETNIPIDKKIPTFEEPYKFVEMENSVFDVTDKEFYNFEKTIVLNTDADKNNNYVFLVEPITTVSVSYKNKTHDIEDIKNIDKIRNTTMNPEPLQNNFLETYANIERNTAPKTKETAFEQLYDFELAANAVSHTATATISSIKTTDNSISRSSSTYLSTNPTFLQSNIKATTKSTLKYSPNNIKDTMFTELYKSISESTNVKDIVTMRTASNNYQSEINNTMNNFSQIKYSSTNITGTQSNTEKSLRNMTRALIEPYNFYGTEITIFDNTPDVINNEMIRTKSSNIEDIISTTENIEIQDPKRNQTKKTTLRSGGTNSTLNTKNTLNKLYSYIETKHNMFTSNNAASKVSEDLSLTKLTLTENHNINYVKRNEAQNIIKNPIFQQKNLTETFVSTAKYSPVNSKRTYEFNGTENTVFDTTLKATKANKVMSKLNITDNNESRLHKTIINDDFTENNIIEMFNSTKQYTAINIKYTTFTKFNFKKFENITNTISDLNVQAPLSNRHKTETHDDYGNYITEINKIHDINRNQSTLEKENTELLINNTVSKIPYSITHTKTSNFDLTQEGTNKEKKSIKLPINITKPIKKIEAASDIQNVFTDVDIHNGIAVTLQTTKINPPKLIKYTMFKEIGNTTAHSKKINATKNGGDSINNSISNQFNIKKEQGIKFRKKNTTISFGSTLSYDLPVKKDMISQKAYKTSETEDHLLHSKPNAINDWKSSTNLDILSTLNYPAKTKNTMSEEYNNIDKDTIFENVRMATTDTHILIKPNVKSTTIVSQTSNNQNKTYLQQSISTSESSTRHTLFVTKDSLLGELALKDAGNAVFKNTSIRDVLQNNKASKITTKHTFPFIRDPLFDELNVKDIEIDILKDTPKLNVQQNTITTSEDTTKHTHPIVKDSLLGEQYLKQTSSSIFENTPETQVQQYNMTSQSTMKYTTSITKNPLSEELYLKNIGNTKFKKILELNDEQNISTTSGSTTIVSSITKESLLVGLHLRETVIDLFKNKQLKVPKNSIMSENITKHPNAVIKDISLEDLHLKDSGDAVFRNTPQVKVPENIITSGSITPHTLPTGNAVFKNTPEPQVEQSNLTTSEGTTKYSLPVARTSLLAGHHLKHTKNDIFKNTLQLIVTENIITSESINKHTIPIIEPGELRLKDLGNPVFKNIPELKVTQNTKTTSENITKHTLPVTKETGNVVFKNTPELIVKQNITKTSESTTKRTFPPITNMLLDELNLKETRNFVFKNTIELKSQENITSSQSNTKHTLPFVKQSFLGKQHLKPTSSTVFKITPKIKVEQSMITTDESNTEHTVSVTEDTLLGEMHLKDSKNAVLENILELTAGKNMTTMSRNTTKHSLSVVKEYLLKNLNDSRNTVFKNTNVTTTYESSTKHTLAVIKDSLLGKLYLKETGSTIFENTPELKHHKNIAMMSSNTKKHSFSVTKDPLLEELYLKGTENTIFKNTLDLRTQQNSTATTEMTTKRTLHIIEETFHEELDSTDTENDVFENKSEKQILENIATLESTTNHILSVTKDSLLGEQYSKNTLSRSSPKRNVEKKIITPSGDLIKQTYPVTADLLLGKLYLKDSKNPVLINTQELKVQQNITKPSLCTIKHTTPVKKVSLHKELYLKETRSALFKNTPELTVKQNTPKYTLPISKYPLFEELDIRDTGNTTHKNTSKVRVQQNITAFESTAINTSSIAKYSILGKQDLKHTLNAVLPNVLELKAEQNMTTSSESTAKYTLPITKESLLGELSDSGNIVFNNIPELKDEHHIPMSESTTMHGLHVIKESLLGGLNYFENTVFNNKSELKAKHHIATISGSTIINTLPVTKDSLFGELILKDTANSIYKNKLDLKQHVTRSTSTIHGFPLIKENLLKELPLKENKGDIFKITPQQKVQENIIPSGSLIKYFLPISKNSLLGKLSLNDSGNSVFKNTSKLIAEPNPITTSESTSKYTLSVTKDSLLGELYSKGTSNTVFKNYPGLKFKQNIREPSASTTKYTLPALKESSLEELYTRDIESAMIKNTSELIIDPNITSTSDSTIKHILPVKASFFDKLHLNNTRNAVFKNTLELKVEPDIVETTPKSSAKHTLSITKDLLLENLHLKNTEMNVLKNMLQLTVEPDTITSESIKKHTRPITKDSLFEELHLNDTENDVFKNTQEREVQQNFITPSRITTIHTLSVTKDSLLGELYLKDTGNSLLPNTANLKENSTSKIKTTFNYNIISIEPNHVWDYSPSEPHTSWISQKSNKSVATVTDLKPSTNTMEQKDITRAPKVLRNANLKTKMELNKGISNKIINGSYSKSMKLLNLTSFLTSHLTTPNSNFIISETVEPKKIFQTNKMKTFATQLSPTTVKSDELNFKRLTKENTMKGIPSHDTSKTVTEVKLSKILSTLLDFNSDTTSKIDNLFSNTASPVFEDNVTKLYRHSVKMVTKAIPYTASITTQLYEDISRPKLVLIKSNNSSPSVTYKTISANDNLHIKPIQKYSDLNKLISEKFTKSLLHNVRAKPFSNKKTSTGYVNFQIVDTTINFTEPKQVPKTLHKDNFNTTIFPMKIQTIKTKPSFFKKTKPDPFELSIRIGIETTKDRIQFSLISIEEKPINISHPLGTKSTEMFVSPLNRNQIKLNNLKEFYKNDSPKNEVLTVLNLTRRVNNNEEIEKPVTPFNDLKQINLPSITTKQMLVTVTRIPEIRTVSNIAKNMSTIDVDNKTMIMSSTTFLEGKQIPQIMKVSSTAKPKGKQHEKIAIEPASLTDQMAIETLKQMYLEHLQKFKPNNDNTEKVNAKNDNVPNSTLNVIKQESTVAKYGEKERDSIDSLYRENNDTDDDTSLYVPDNVQKFKKKSLINDAKKQDISHSATDTLNKNNDSIDYSEYRLKTNSPSLFEGEQYATVFTLITDDLKLFNSSTFIIEHERKPNNESRTSVNSTNVKTGLQNGTTNNTLKNNKIIGITNQSITGKENATTETNKKNYNSKKKSNTKKRKKLISALKYKHDIADVLKKLVNAKKINIKMLNSTNKHDVLHSLLSKIRKPIIHINKTHSQYKNTLIPVNTNPHRRLSNEKYKTQMDKPTRKSYFSHASDAETKHNYQIFTPADKNIKGNGKNMSLNKLPPITSTLFPTGLTIKPNEQTGSFSGVKLNTSDKALNYMDSYKYFNQSLKNMPPLIPAATFNQIGIKDKITKLMTSKAYIITHTGTTIIPLNTTSSISLVNNEANKRRGFNINDPFYDKDNKSYLKKATLTTTELPLTKKHYITIKLNIPYLTLHATTGKSRANLDKTSNTKKYMEFIEHERNNAPTISNQITDSLDKETSPISNLALNDSHLRRHVSVNSKPFNESSTPVINDFIPNNKTFNQIIEAIDNKLTQIYSTTPNLNNSSMALNMLAPHNLSSIEGEVSNIEHIQNNINKIEDPEKHILKSMSNYNLLGKASDLTLTKKAMFANGEILPIQTHNNLNSSIKVTDNSYANPDTYITSKVSTETHNKDRFILNTTHIKLSQETSTYKPIKHITLESTPFYKKTLNNFRNNVMLPSINNNDEISELNDITTEQSLSSINKTISILSSNQKVNTKTSHLWQEITNVKKLPVMYVPDMQVNLGKLPSKKKVNTFLSTKFKITYKSKLVTSIPTERNNKNKTANNIHNTKGNSSLKLVSIHNTIPFSLYQTNNSLGIPNTSLDVNKHIFTNTVSDFLVSTTSAWPNEVTVSANTFNNFKINTNHKITPISLDEKTSNKKNIYQDFLTTKTILDRPMTDKSYSKKWSSYTATLKKEENQLHNKKYYLGFSTLGEHYLGQSLFATNPELSNFISSSYTGADSGAKPTAKTFFNSTLPSNYQSSSIYTNKKNSNIGTEIEKKTKLKIPNSALSKTRSIIKQNINHYTTIRNQYTTQSENLHYYKNKHEIAKNVLKDLADDIVGRDILKSNDIIISEQPTFTTIFEIVSQNLTEIQADSFATEHKSNKNYTQSTQTEIATTSLNSKKSTIIDIDYRKQDTSANEIRLPLNVSIEEQNLVTKISNFDYKPKTTPIIPTDTKDQTAHIIIVPLNTISKNHIISQIYILDPKTSKTIWSRHTRGKIIHNVNTTKTYQKPNKITGNTFTSSIKQQAKTPRDILVTTVSPKVMVNVNDDKEFQNGKTKLPDTTMLNMNSNVLKTADPPLLYNSIEQNRDLKDTNIPNVDKAKYSSKPNIPRFPKLVTSNEYKDTTIFTPTDEHSNRLLSSSSHRSNIGTNVLNPQKIYYNPLSTVFFETGSIEGKNYNIYSSRLNRHYFLRPPLKSVTKHIKYNTYQPPIKEDYDNPKYKQVTKLNPRPNVSCSILKTMRHKFHSTFDFIEFLKASNCSADNLTIHVNIKNNRFAHPPVKQNSYRKVNGHTNLKHPSLKLTKKVFTRLGHKESLLNSFEKTKLFPIKPVKTVLPKIQPSVVKRINVGGNRKKEIMSMNTHDFFSQHRLATPKNLKNPIPKLRLNKPLLVNTRFSMLRPKFDTLDMPRQKFDKSKTFFLPLTNGEETFAEVYAVQPHNKKISWKQQIGPLREAIQNNPVALLPSPVNNVLDKPLTHIKADWNGFIPRTETAKKKIWGPSDLIQPTRPPNYDLSLPKPLTPSGDQYNLRQLQYRRNFQLVTHTPKGLPITPVTNWWLDDMYLKVRLPLPINSNPGMVFPRRHFAKMEEVADLGALFIDDILDYKEMLDRGELPLERATSREKGQPLCMEQFYRLLGVCRIPEMGKDRLELPPVKSGSEEQEELVVVACKNYFYPIPVKAVDRGRITPGEIQAQLLHAMVDAAGAPPAPKVGLLTSMNRDQWAKAREHLLKDEVNRMNLELISRALCILCLDEAGGDRADTDPETNAMLRAMHGAGTRHHSANRWFDKTVQLIISSDGTVGMCYEHSAAEGVAVVRLAERALARAEVADRPAPPPALLPAPQAMKWNIVSEVQRSIESAARDLDRAISDLDFKVYTYRGYGREFMKSCRTSPDVYIQLAIQYAYYKMYGYLVTTYESASLRRFRQGRVDNIRSAHGAALAWAAAMCTAEASPLNDGTDEGQKKVSFNLYGEQKKLELFEEAARKQTSIMEANILGKGIDNHLLGLREMARETLGEVPPVFCDAAYKQMFEFKMSTSQVTTTTDGTFMGYGAVCPDGYGCCYNPKKDSIIFCIASFVSSTVTNTEAYRQSLEEALDSMKLMFQAKRVENSK